MSPTTRLPRANGALPKEGKPPSQWSVSAAQVQTRPAPAAQAPARRRGRRGLGRGACGQNRSVSGRLCSRARFASPQETASRAPSPSGPLVMLRRSGRRSFGDPGLAQALEHWLKSGQYVGVLEERPPERCRVSWDRTAGGNGLLQRVGLPHNLFRRDRRDDSHV